jgi:hypothetical protein
MRRGDKTAGYFATKGTAANLLHKIFIEKIAVFPNI